MQKNMRTFSKGQQKLQQYFFEYVPRTVSDVENCLISPNQQYLALIHTRYENGRGRYQYFIKIIIVNLISKKNTQESIKIRKQISQKIISQFSEDSFYLVVLIDSKTIIFNILDRQEYELNYEVTRIISIDSNQILKLFSPNLILHYSLAQKELIKYIELQGNYYYTVIDSIDKNIYLVQINCDQFYIMFQQKILKTLNIKFPDNNNFNFQLKINYQLLPQQLLVLYSGPKKLDFENVHIQNLRNSKLVRKFNKQIVSNPLINEYTQKITNARQKNNSFYVYYLKEIKKELQSIQKDNFFRFNLISGVNRKLYFKPRIICEQVTFSDNVYADIYNETILRHYYYKK